MGLLLERSVGARATCKIRAEEESLGGLGWMRDTRPCPGETSVRKDLWRMDWKEGKEPGGCLEDRAAGSTGAGVAWRV